MRIILSFTTRFPVDFFAFATAGPGFPESRNYPNNARSAERMAVENMFREKTRSPTQGLSGDPHR